MSIRSRLRKYLDFIYKYEAGHHRDPLLRKRNTKEERDCIIEFIGVGSVISGDKSITIPVIRGDRAKQVNIAGAFYDFPINIKKEVQDEKVPESKN